MQILKFQWFVLLTAACALPKGFALAQNHAQDRAIVAGRRIGHLVLGAEMDAAVKPLGPPSEEDGASGRLRATWISHGSKPQRLDVTGERDFNATRHVDDFYIRQIRVTSPFFRLSNGIQTGDKLEKIRRAFPQLRAVGTSKYAGHKVTVYDSKSAGIAFEVAGNGENRRVLSVVVHRKGRGINQDYLTAVQGFESLP